MKKRTTKPRARLLLPTLLIFSPVALSSAEAILDAPQTPRIHGALSSAGRTLIPSLLKHPYVYYNLDSTSPPAPDEINQALDYGFLVILDQTETRSSAQIDRLTAKMNGLKFSQPFVLINSTPEGTRHFYPGNAQSVFPLLAQAKKQLKSRKKRNSTTSYHVGRPVFVNFNYPNLSCPLAKELKKEWYGLSKRIKLSGSTDPCRGDASYHAIVRLDYFPSTNDGANAQLPVGKILRISGGAEGAGGAGWHLTESQINKNQTFRSNIERTTWFGPYVDAYETRISLSDNDVALLDHQPHNSNPATDIHNTSTLTVGQGFGFNLMVGSSGPLVGVSHNVMSSHSSSVTLKYSLNEYRLINSTSGNQFRIKWKRANPPLPMHSAEEVRNGAMPVNSDLFNGIAYANFVPGYVVTYNAPFSKSGESTIHISAKAEVMAALTDVNHTNPRNTFISDHTFQFNNAITIDWDSPYFMQEVPVAIKAVKDERSYCLTMAGEDQEVIGAPCSPSNKQLWGLNKHQQYVSVENPRLCLSAQNIHAGHSDRLTVSACRLDDTQKWSWQDQDALVNGASGHAVSITGAAPGDSRNMVLRGIGGPFATPGFKPYIQPPM